MISGRQEEIDRNYDFFQRNLTQFIEKHRGQYALLRSGGVVAWFDRPGDAFRAGLEEFPDELFSIQEVEDQPAEIGLMSLAID